MTTEHTLNDVVAIHGAFLPNRATRRQMAGARCHLCGLGIVAVDMCLVDVETANGFSQTRPIHKQCTSLLWDMVNDANEEANDWAEDPGVDAAPEAG